MDDDQITIRIPMSAVVNLSEYRNYRNLIECYLCKNLATKPSYCENCKNSFCSNCLKELNLPENKCPICMLENAELNVSNDKFYDFFKDLTILCPICDEKVKYPDIVNHTCFKVKMSKQEKKEEDEYRIINNIIHFRCPKCKEFVPFTQKENHMINCPAAQIPSVNVPGGSMTQLVPCRFCSKNINPNDELSHLAECPEILKKLSISGKDNPSAVQYKPVNVLEVLDSFTKFSENLDNANLQKLITTISSLERTVTNLMSNTEFSYCYNCKNVKKNFDLFLCKCCNKKYCTNCCTPCTKCNGIISKNCLFTCENCKLLKCPLCEIATGNFCMCLEHKFCKACFENPNVSNISIALLKGPHVNCAYMKLLDYNILVIKVPQFNFKSEISFNSIRQAISISLIKKGQEAFSRIFQININDKLIIFSENAQMKIGSSLDYWAVDMRNVEGNFDYMILNFNTNPNYAYTLNKLNSSVFEQLSPANTVIGGMYDVFLGRKQLINNILFQKL